LSGDLVAVAFALNSLGGLILATYLLANFSSSSFSHNLRGNVENLDIGFGQDRVLSAVSTGGKGELSADAEIIWFS
jgi:hypothetical protein